MTAVLFNSSGPFRWRQLRILQLYMDAATVLPFLLLATDAVAAPAVAASDGYDTMNRFWAKGPFLDPFVSVGTPSGDTSADQAGLLVVRDEYS